jgi:hypothetical protein
MALDVVNNSVAVCGVTGNVMIWLLGLFAFSTSFVTYSFEGLVEGSTVVVYGDLRGPEATEMKIFNVVAGELDETGNDSIEIEISKDAHSSDPRLGRALYFIKQCNGISEIAGQGQGAIGVVGDRFMIEFEPGKISRLASQSEIGKFISNSGRLAASVKCPKI